VFINIQPTALNDFTNFTLHSIFTHSVRERFRKQLQWNTACSKYFSELSHSTRNVRSKQCLKFYRIYSIYDFFVFRNSSFSHHYADTDCSARVNAFPTLKNQTVNHQKKLCFSLDPSYWLSQQSQNCRADFFPTFKLSDKTVPL
jgi:hypothetical protein